MDGLLSLLLTFFGALAMVVVLPIVNLVVGVVWLVAEVLLNLTFRQKKEEGSDSEPPPSSWLKKGTRLLGSVLLGAGVVACLVVLMLNSFFYQDTLRWALSKVDKASRIQVSFQSAEGNLWTGKHTLYRLQIKRRGDAFTNYNLRLEKLEVDLKVMDLFRFLNTVEKIELQQMKGKVFLVRHRLPAPPPSTGPGKRSFRVKNLHIKGLDIRVMTGKKAKKKALHLEIIDLENQSLHSHSAWMDLMFRSKMRGHLQDLPFTVERNTLKEGTEYEWKLQKAPVAALALLTGGPMTWFTEGTLNLKIRNRWTPAFRELYQLKCSLIFEKFKAQKPRRVKSANLRRIARPMVEFLNATPEQLKLNFSVGYKTELWKGNTSQQIKGFNETLWKGIRILWRQSYKPKKRSISNQILKNLKKKVPAPRGKKEPARVLPPKQKKLKKTTKKSRNVKPRKRKLRKRKLRKRKLRKSRKRKLRKRKARPRTR